MKILAIDPGPTVSSSVIYDPATEFIEGNTEPNGQLLRYLRAGRAFDELVIEQVASYGMPVGEDVFETVYWSGRFAEAFRNAHRIKRLQVKRHICPSVGVSSKSTPTDANIRQALIDRFGPPGTKKEPGKTYGLKGGEWQALALAVTFAEVHLNQQPEMQT